MKIKVKFFAILRERVGASTIIKDIKEGSTVGELWESLRVDYPALAPSGVRLLYAVNQEYVGPEHVLKEQDEVVFIPPVSGGLSHVSRN